MAIFHQELGQVCTTMYLQGSAADNTVCKMHANDTVAACAAGRSAVVGASSAITIPYPRLAPFLTVVSRQ